MPWVGPVAYQVQVGSLTLAVISLGSAQVAPSSLLKVTQTVRGASHLVLDPQGLIVLHRDYWDAAEELYMKLPLLGMLMRGLRRMLAA